MVRAADYTPVHGLVRRIVHGRAELPGGRNLHARARGGVSAWLLAWMVTVAGDGTLAGAVYRPDALMVPALAVQVTP